MSSLSNLNSYRRTMNGIQSFDDGMGGTMEDGIVTCNSLNIQDLNVQNIQPVTTSASTNLFTDSTSTVSLGNETSTTVKVSNAIITPNSFQSSNTGTSYNFLTTQTAGFNFGPYYMNQSEFRANNPASNFLLFSNNTGGLSVGGDGGLILGRMSSGYYYTKIKSSYNTCNLDFRSSTNSVFYDSRIQSVGGTTSNGGATLNFTSRIMNLNGSESINLNMTQSDITASDYIYVNAQNSMNLTANDYLSVIGNNKMDVISADITINGSDRIGVISNEININTFTTSINSTTSIDLNSTSIGLTGDNIVIDSTANLNLTGDTINLNTTPTGKVYLAKNGNYSLESGINTNTAYLNFHSGDNTNDYDVQLLSTGGEAGTNGRGNFTIDASHIYLESSALTINSHRFSYIPWASFYSANFGAVTSLSGFINYPTGTSCPSGQNGGVCRYRYMVMGCNLYLDFHYYQPSAGLAGSGVYQYTIPLIGSTVFSLDTSQLIVSTAPSSPTGTVLGRGNFKIIGTSSSENFEVFWTQQNSTNGLMLFESAGSSSIPNAQSSARYGYASTGALVVNFQAIIPVTV